MQAREMYGGASHPHPLRTRLLSGLEAGRRVPLDPVEDAKEGLQVLQRHLGEERRPDIGRIEGWDLQQALRVAEVDAARIVKALDPFPEVPDSVLDTGHEAPECIPLFLHTPGDLAGGVEGVPYLSYLSDPDVAQVDVADFLEDSPGRVYLGLDIERADLALPAFL